MKKQDYMSLPKVSNSSVKSINNSQWMKVQTNSKQGRKESSMQLKSMQFTCINI
jgi:hypothetical protein